MRRSVLSPGSWAVVMRGQFRETSMNGRNGPHRLVPAIRLIPARAPCRERERMRLSKRAWVVSAAVTVIGVVAAWTVTANAAPAPAAKAPNTPAAALRLAIDKAAAHV